MFGGKSFGSSKSLDSLDSLDSALRYSRRRCRMARDRFGETIENTRASVDDNGHRWDDTSEENTGELCIEGEANGESCHKIADGNDEESNLLRSPCLDILGISGKASRDLVEVSQVMAVKGRGVTHPGRRSHSRSDPAQELCLKTPSEGHGIRALQ